MYIIYNYYTPTIYGLSGFVRSSFVVFHGVSNYIGTMLYGVPLFICTIFYLPTLATI